MNHATEPTTDELDHAAACIGLDWPLADQDDIGRVLMQAEANRTLDASDED
jgi:hypothetical protein